MGTGHKRVSKKSGIQIARSHTSWEWDKARRGSARSLGSRSPDHILPESRTRPGDSQWAVLHLDCKITYFLRMGQGQEMVSRQSCTQILRSHTLWEQEQATRGSAGSLAPKSQDHIRSESRNRPQEGHQESCIKIATSHTSWEQEKAIRGSAGSHASKWQITYILRVGQGHERVSREYSIQIARSHTNWEWARPWEGQQAVLHPNHKITYFLRVRKGHETVSK
jgi:hypothetical protein